MNKLQIKFTISFIYNADKNNHFVLLAVHVHLNKNVPQRSTFEKIIILNTLAINNELVTHKQ